MLKDFQATLSAGKSVNQKHVSFYIRGVRDCYKFFPGIHVASKNPLDR